jgi:hypothetical protein
MGVEAFRRESRKNKRGDLKDSTKEPFDGRPFQLLEITFKTSYVPLHCLML